MKVSELTAEFLQEYVRADGSAATMLKPMLAEFFDETGLS